MQPHCASGADSCPRGRGRGAGRGRGRARGPGPLRRRRADRGAVTVEFAVALPAVAVVVTLAIAGVLLVDGQGRLQLAAATAARSLGRGDTDGARSALARLAPGAQQDVERHDGLVCVTVERAGSGPFALVGLRGTSCAADGGR